MSLLNVKSKKKAKAKKSKAKVPEGFKAAQNIPVSDNSLDSTFGSDVEVIATQRFPFVADPTELNKKKKRKMAGQKNESNIHKHKKDGSLPSKISAESNVQKEVDLQSKKTKKLKKKDTNFKGGPAKSEPESGPVKLGQSGVDGSGVDRLHHFELGLEKRRKKKKKLGLKLGEPTVMDKIQVNDAKGEKQAKKRKIENIFEEAEICMENAVPKKVEEVRQLLKKTTKSKGVMDSKRKSGSGPRRKRDYEDLSFKKSRVDVDSTLLENGEGISAGLSGAKRALEKLEKAEIRPEMKLPDIDPNKFIPVKTQKLRTAVPEFEEAGESESDEEEVQRMNLMEAFADDDIADEFMKEKEEAEEESKPKTVDLRLPGWGSWGGTGITMNNRKRERKHQSKLVVKFPGTARQDQTKKLVIVNDAPSAKFRKLQVDDLPSEFPSVASYEASIRAPIGPTWVPEQAHKSLTAPPVVTKMGAIIQPMDESHLIKDRKKAEDAAQKMLNKSIKAGKPIGRVKNQKPSKK